MWKCKANKFFSLQVVFGHGLYHNNRKHTRTRFKGLTSPCDHSDWGEQAGSLCFHLHVGYCSCPWTLPFLFSVEYKRMQDPTNLCNMKPCYKQARNRGMGRCLSKGTHTLVMSSGNLPYKDLVVKNSVLEVLYGRPAFPSHTKMWGDGGVN